MSGNIAGCVDGGGDGPVVSGNTKGAVQGNMQMASRRVTVRGAAGPEGSRQGAPARHEAVGTHGEESPAPGVCRGGGVCAGGSVMSNITQPRDHSTRGEGRSLQKGRTYGKQKVMQQK